MSPSIRSSDAGNAARPRILMVSDERAWPTLSGYRRRTAQCLTMLAEVGDVEWIAVPRSPVAGEAGLKIPGHLSGVVRASLADAPSRSRLGTAVRWALSRQPWVVAAGNWRNADRRIRSLTEGTFDLVWAMGIDPLLACRRAGVESRHIVMDTDVESEKLRLRLDADTGRGMSHRLRNFIGTSDVGRWRRLERHAYESISAVSVCSAEERDLIGATSWVMPNSYDEPVDAAATPRADDLLLFVGSLRYDPNIDGLEFFCADVLPEIRRRRPNVRLRVVGHGLAATHPLRSMSGVELLDSVDDVSVEVARATASVVPLRWGGGTRIKIIEAFAHRTPIVSTTIGAAGLGVVDGRELLIADDADSLVEACDRVLSDAQLREDLADRGQVCFRARFEARAVRAELAHRVSELLANDPANDRANDPANDR